MPRFAQRRGNGRIQRPLNAVRWSEELERSWYAWRDGSAEADAWKPWWTTYCMGLRLNEAAYKYLSRYLFHSCFEHRADIARKKLCPYAYGSKLYQQHAVNTGSFNPG
jgi:hypothetical protein